jgi:hypothetical protein
VPLNVLPWKSRSKGDSHSDSQSGREHRQASQKRNYVPLPKWDPTEVLYYENSKAQDSEDELEEAFLSDSDESTAQGDEEKIPSFQEFAEMARENILKSELHNLPQSPLGRSDPNEDYGLPLKVSVAKNLARWISCSHIRNGGNACHHTRRWHSESCLLSC